MKLHVGICTHNDEEWIEQAIKSVYPVVDSIVVAIPFDFLWDNLAIKYRDKTADILQRMISKYDIDNKITVVERNGWLTQHGQRQACLDAMDITDGDIAMQLDGDEIWNLRHLREIREYFRDHSKLEALAGTCVEFWQKTNLAICDEKGNVNYPSRPRFHRYHTGSYYGYKNEMYYKDGTIYPTFKQHPDYPKLLKCDDIPTLKGIIYKHYGWVHNDRKALEKYETMKYRERNNKFHRYVEKWYWDVWCQYSKTPKGVLSTKYGISNTKKYKGTTKWQEST